MSSYISGAAKKVTTYFRNSGSTTTGGIAPQKNKDKTPSPNVSPQYKIDTTGAEPDVFSRGASPRNDSSDSPFVVDLDDIKMSSPSRNSRSSSRNSISRTYVKVGENGRIHSAPTTPTGRRSKMTFHPKPIDQFNGKRYSFSFSKTNDSDSDSHFDTFSRSTSGNSSRRNSTGGYPFETHNGMDTYTYNTNEGQFPENCEFDPQANINNPQYDFQPEGVPNIANKANDLLFEKNYFSVFLGLILVTLKSIGILIYYSKMPLSTEIFLNASIASTLLFLITLREYTVNAKKPVRQNFDGLEASHKFLIVANALLALQWLFTNLLTRNPYLCLFLAGWSIYRSVSHYSQLKKMDDTLEEVQINMKHGYQQAFV